MPHCHQFMSHCIFLTQAMCFLSAQKVFSQFFIAKGFGKWHMSTSSHSDYEYQIPKCFHNREHPMLEFECGAPFYLGCRADLCRDRTFNHSLFALFSSLLIYVKVPKNDKELLSLHSPSQKLAISFMSSQIPS